MKYLKRIFYSIVYRPLSSLLLFVAILILGTFTSSCYSIYIASNNLNNLLMDELGAKVYVPAAYYNGSATKDSEFYEKIKNEEFVSNYLKDFETNENVVQSEIYHSFFSSTIKTSFKEKDMTLVDDYYDVDLISFSNYPFVDKDEIEITSGRNLTKDEIEKGSKVIIVNENLIDNNGKAIQVGDFLPIFYEIYDVANYERKVIHREKITELEVVGTFQLTSNYWFETTKKDETGKPLLSSNFQYVSYATLKDISDSIKSTWSKYENIASDIGLYGDIRFLSAYYQFKDIHSLDDFLVQLKNGLDDDYHTFSSMQSYLEVNDQMVKFNIISILIIGVATISSIILLSIIIFMTIKSRQKEIGLYLALGEKRKNIMLQIICEIGLICLLGLSGSLFIGNKIGYHLSNKMIGTYIKQELKMNHSIDEDKIKDSYEIKLDHHYAHSILIGGSSIIIISCAFPLWKMMRLKPKEILL